MLFLQVFGNGVTDIVLSQGVLAVSYSNKSVKLYSLEHILHRVCISVFKEYMQMFLATILIVNIYILNISLLY